MLVSPDIYLKTKQKATKSWHRKFEPRVHVWKLKEEKTCEEYRRIVGDKVTTTTTV